MDAPCVLQSGFNAAEECSDFLMEVDDDREYGLPTPAVEPSVLHPVVISPDVSPEPARKRAKAVHDPVPVDIAMSPMEQFRAALVVSWPRDHGPVTDLLVTQFAGLMSVDDPKSRIRVAMAGEQKSYAPAAQIRAMYDSIMLQAAQKRVIEAAVASATNEASKQEAEEASKKEAEAKKVAAVAVKKAEQKATRAKKKADQVQSELKSKLLLTQFRQDLAIQQSMASAAADAARQLGEQALQVWNACV